MSDIESEYQPPKYTPSDRYPTECCFENENNLWIGDGFGQVGGNPKYFKHMTFEEALARINESIEKGIRLGEIWISLYCSRSQMTCEQFLDKVYALICEELKYPVNMFRARLCRVRFEYNFNIMFYLEPSKIHNGFVSVEQRVEIRNQEAEMVNKRKAQVTKLAELIREAPNGDHYCAIIAPHGCAMVDTGWFRGWRSYCG